MRSSWSSSCANRPATVRRRSEIPLADRRLELASDRDFQPSTDRIQNHQFSGTDRAPPKQAPTARKSSARTGNGCLLATHCRHPDRDATPRDTLRRIRTRADPQQDKRSSAALRSPPPVSAIEPCAATHSPQQRRIQHAGIEKSDKRDSPAHSRPSSWSSAASSRSASRRFARVATLYANTSFSGSRLWFPTIRAGNVPFVTRPRDTAAKPSADRRPVAC